MDSYDQLLAKFKQGSFVRESDVNEALNHWNKDELKECAKEDGNRILHRSCSNGWYDVSIRLIDEFGLDPNVNNSTGETALFWACRSGNAYLTVKLISSYECNPFLPENHGYTPFDQAIVAKNSVMIELIPQAAVLASHAPIKNGDTMLHKCASIGLSKLFKDLVSNHYCKPDIENNKGETPLHIICSSIVEQGYNDDKGQILFYLLMNAKVSPRVKFKNKHVSVLRAVCIAINSDGNHDASILHYLIIDRGCDLKDNSDLVLYTLCNTLPFGEEKNRKHVEVLSFLTINKGFDPFFTLFSGRKVCVLCCPCSRPQDSIKNFSPSFGKQLRFENAWPISANLAEFLWNLYSNSTLSECECEEIIDLFEFLKSYKPINLLCDKNGNTVLHKLCSIIKENLQTTVAKIFINYIASHRCKPDIENNKGETPLHIICSSIVEQGYTPDKAQILYYLIKVFPNIKFSNSDISVLSAVCKAILNGNHDPSILHDLIFDSGCDPSNDRNLILYILYKKNYRLGKPQLIDLLYHLVVNMKLDPHITLKNGRKVCVMCTPAIRRIYDHGIERYMVRMPTHDILNLIQLFYHVYTKVTCSNACNACNFYPKLNEWVKKVYIYYTHDVIDDSVAILVKLITTFGFETSHDSGIVTDADTLKDIIQNIQNPLHSARVICCLIPPYSLSIYSLFYDLINSSELDLMSKADIFGNTLLHLACLFYHGDPTLIEYLLSTGKTDPLCVNNYQQTPLTLLALSSKDDFNIQELITKFGETKVSHPIESYVNIIILGNPGVDGKSTLVKVINDRHDVLLGRFRSVSGVELCTAGIVPHVLNDKDMGRIIVHDLAGQVEYYSSHTAVLDNLLQGSAGVFVIVVSLADESSTESLQFWLSVVENASSKSFKLNHVFVVTSHYDANVTDKAVKLRKLCSTFLKLKSSDVICHTVADSVFSLDCRKLGGGQLTSLISSLTDACESVRSDNIREMSIYCHMLYDFLRSHGKAVYSMKELIEAIKRRMDCFLPTGANQLFNIIQSLSSTGLIMYLGELDNPLDEVWIIVDKSVLLKNLNGVLFAPEDFKEHIDQLVSKTGIVKISELSHHCNLEYNYDPDMIAQFLESMELSHEINKKIILSSNLVPFSESVTNERYLFIPALIKNTISRPDTDKFQFGWCLQCSDVHSFFLSQFIHIIILHLLKYTENRSPDNPIDRQCHIWNNGIYWKDRGGATVLVEMFNQNKCLVLLMSYCELEWSQDMTVLRKRVISEVLACKNQVLLKTPVNEFVIDNSNLQYPQILENISKTSLLFNIHGFHKCYRDGKENVLAEDDVTRIEVSVLLNGTNIKEQCESIFAGRPEFNQGMSRNPIHPSSTEESPTVYSVLLSYKSRLIDMVQSNPLKLANELVAKGLLSQDTENAVSATLEISNYDKADKIMNEIIMLFKHVNDCERFLKFCQVLKDHDQLLLGKLVEEMEQTVHPTDEPPATDVNICCSVLLKYKPQLLGIIGYPEVLAVQLVSQNLLSQHTQDHVRTAPMSRFDKANMIIDEIVRYFENHINDSEGFLKFCKVLKDHDQPGLDRLAMEMEQAVEMAEQL